MVSTIRREEHALWDDGGDIASNVTRLACEVKEASQSLAYASEESRNKALRCASRQLRQNKKAILSANEQDCDMARQHLPPASPLLDRLALTEARIESMATGLENIADIDDPLGRVLASWSCAGNGLRIKRVSVPLGVIAVIYEARPNVTADAAGLCIKSGNGALLRAGSESLRSSLVIMQCMQEGLREAGLPPRCVCLIPHRSREAVGVLLSLQTLIDIIVPRGGASLIKRVEEESRIPVIRHLQGLCHSYIHRQADKDKARAIVFNAKMRRPGICGATETLLIDRDVIATHLAGLVDDLQKAGCVLCGDEDIVAWGEGAGYPITRASDEDWATEYLEARLSMRAVDDIHGAIDHIQRYGSHHTEAIITEDKEAVRLFMGRVDAAILMHNTSTEFADGGEFGMGAEIGISTNKLHARGPVGAHQLTSYSYHVDSDGSIRP